MSWRIVAVPLLGIALGVLDLALFLSGADFLNIIIQEVFLKVGE